MTMTGLPLAVVFFLFFFLFLIHFQQPIHIGLCRQKFPHFLTGTPVLGVGFLLFLQQFGILRLQVFDLGQLLTTFLGKMVDLYTVMTCYFADAMEEVDRVAEDKGLKESLGRYAIESGAIMEQVYRKKMEIPIEDMKRFLDGILHIHDEGRTRMSMGALFGIVEEAEERLSEKENSVAP